MNTAGSAAARVADRRRLRFATLADLQSEVDRIEAAERSGRLHRSGNWTTGQTLGHLAAWMSYPYEGFPMPRAPWFVRAFVAIRRNRYLNGAMPRGLRIPGAKGGTFGIDELPLEEGLARVRAAMERLARDTSPPLPSPVFGRMTHDECVRLNLRHAELHLGCLHPEG